jgi:hypothetical protein
LETLAPINKLDSGASATHIETRELYADVDFPKDEEAVQDIVENLGLE